MLEEKISAEVANRLPHGFKIVKSSTCKDMDGSDRRCLVVVWPERPEHGGGVRKASFCVETGEYLGDYVPGF